MWIEIILCYVVLVLIFALLTYLTQAEFFGMMMCIMIITGPIMIPFSKTLFEYADMEKQVVKIFGEDIEREYVRDENKLIVKSKEGTYEVYYDKDKKIDLIKNITKNMQDEEKQREKTKEILKNL
ncbi:hypothetical protein [Bacillus sp. NPDC094106]|uniref:hypothetical protein n=1 Tax=Bacillus sp. NPDC094106 TaxID=3363949 RepID=UPI0037F8DBD2